MKMPLNLTRKTLAFDTSTARGSVAILEGPEIRAEIRFYSSQTHSTLLLSSIDFMLEHLGWSLKDLNLVAAGIGPGSFTGIRIGVATALGVSQSCSIPFAGISGLDALAHQAKFLNGQIGVVLDAHRSQVYYGEYVSDSEKIRRTQKSELIDISDLERRLAGRHLYIIGDLNACRFMEARQSSKKWPRPVSVDMFLAAGIGRLANTRKNSWRSGDYVVSEPMYIRPPDALKNKRRKK
jgi:tRNA threonylcarbamoyladenosine biosynthesis protein TsaB